MRFIIATLLSAAIFMTAPNALNNSEAKAAVAQQAGKVRQQATAPAKIASQSVETPAPLTPEPQKVTATCRTEIAKYDWSQDVALAVAKAESGLDPGIVDNNPATSDYSVGCFQVNIYGALASTRPSEQELKDPTVNVKWAYEHYVANGKSFKGKWGVCREKVDCY